MGSENPFQANPSPYGVKRRGYGGPAEQLFGTVGETRGAAYISLKTGSTSPAVVPLKGEWGRI